MDPTSSFFQMLDVIKNESKLKSYSKEQLLELLASLGEEADDIHRCFPGIFGPIISHENKERIIKALINELQARGIKDCM